jgi:ABC-type multidrug transport system fused ATPase/permease subunit|tara:strand:- start:441 stop:2072 length:1632 start_codon:yes stop_codon:yes gene_type:complete
MKNRINQLKEIFHDILLVSKLTGTLNKKFIIFAVLITSNLTVLLDIIIILAFTLFLTGEIDTFQIIEAWVGFVKDNIYILPFVIVIRYGSKILQTYLMKTLEVTVEKNLRVYVMNQIFKQKDFSISDAYFYINKITSHVSFFYSALTNFLNFVIQSTVYFVYLVFSNSSIIAAFSIGVVVLIVPIKKLVVSSKNYMHKTFLFEKKSDEEIQKVIDNIYLIKILKKDEDELRKFSETSDQVADGQLKNHLYNILSADFPSFLTIFTFSIFIAYFGNFTFITLDYIVITLRLFQSLGGIAGSFSRVINSQIHIQKLKEAVDIDDVDFHHDYSFSKSLKDNDVEINSVNFKYRNSTEWIFENLNLNINKNTHTVITGQNGSGKSTLLGLISGMLIHQSGSIKIARDKLGYIGPTPLILSMSLKENLLYGNKDVVDESKILETCEMFKLFDVINKDILDRQVTNTSLSSGQMQKVGFIRAILSNVEILLLDESTSNLDRNTKSLILDILTDKNITVVNSTHDPTSFSQIDRHIQIDIVDNKRLIYDI